MPHTHAANQRSSIAHAIAAVAGRRVHAATLTVTGLAVVAGVAIGRAAIRHRRAAAQQPQYAEGVIDGMRLAATRTDVSSPADLRPAVGYANLQVVRSGQ